MLSKTISVTIPEQLENFLQKEADILGLSRSRFICNILLDYQENKIREYNDCANQNDGNCNKFDILCRAPQHEAVTCSDYHITGNKL